MYRKILRLAIPNIISNITIPLLGMADLVIAGWLGGAGMIGGIAIGTAIFNFLYWNFGFLRMGTSGFTAQAYGRRDFTQAVRILLRALSVAVGIAAIIIVLQVPVERLALSVMGGSSQVAQWASDYFFVRIWAAPATLSLYAFKGWFIGMQNSKTPMWIAIMMNVVNVGASLFFAFTMDMGIRGVALGTVVAQWSGAAMALIIVWRSYGRLFRGFSVRGLFERSAMWAFFKVNSDIFVRTLCLVAVFTYFTIASSHMGDSILEANTLMLQLFTLFSYMMDGFAYAGEALAGRLYGAGNFAGLRRMVRSIFVWGLALSAVVTVGYAVAGEHILSIFNPSQATLAAAHSNIWWAVAVPLVSFMAFLMDGILVGLTATSVMRNSMLMSTLCFFGVYFSLVGFLGNDALWLAFLIYLFLRGILQIVMGRKRFWPS